MEKEYVLKSLGLSISFYEDPPNKLPLDYIELFHWLKSNSSTKIKAINYWYYTINEIEFHFRLERVNRNTWNVYELELPDKIFFTFDNHEGLKIQEDFEKALKESLKTKGY